MADSAKPTEGNSSFLGKPRGIGHVDGRPEVLDEEITVRIWLSQEWAMGRKKVRQSWKKGDSATDG